MDQTGLRNQVEAAYRAWNDAFNAGDAKALAACYAGDATFLPATHDVIEGPAGVERFFAGLFANGLTGHTLDLLTVHGDGGTVVGAAKWSARGKGDDGAPATFAGVATHVFVKRPDGSLKLRLHTFN
jgi:uncharacterized protein (TIGR02246 family)